MRSSLLTLFISVAVANPFRTHVEVQEIIEASGVGSESAVLHQLADALSKGQASSQGASLNDMIDPTSSVVTSVNTLANTVNVCFWSGTAPLCDGECPSNWTHESDDVCGDGACCAKGKKRHCCRTFDLNNCSWDGTAPFCAGSCDPLNEYDAGQDDCGDGRCCATGKKAKCCKPA